MEERPRGCDRGHLLSMMHECAEIEFLTIILRVRPAGQEKQLCGRTNKIWAQPHGPDLRRTILDRWILSFQRQQKKEEIKDNLNGRLGFEPEWINMDASAAVLKSLMKSTPTVPRA
ncbi:unnamed protein product [Dovyalis caffra]|uniref:Uncharacterized protein n=1 Tax=Dovyalis caffra TaxID=77055 RepID=A0AAV1SEE2_9ROSI|nr:unnamed protein product [Dovyalis caffra]